MNFKRTEQLESFINYILDALDDLKEDVSRRSLAGHICALKEKEYLHRKVEIRQRQAEKHKIQKTISYLTKMGYTTEKDNKLQLTLKGKIKNIFFNSASYTKAKSSGKKGKFLIIFDIPEKQRKIRDLLRKILYNYSAEKIQKSAFIIDNQVAYKSIKKLIKLAEIGKEVKIVKFTKIE